MRTLTDDQVADALKKFGTYRVRRTQSVAERAYDAYCWLAIGLHETGLRNIEGGAVWSATENRWVAATNAEDMDVGCFQISRKWQPLLLEKMVAVKSGTWSPYVLDKTPNDLGYVPQFEGSVQFLRNEFYSYRSYALARGVPTTRTFNFCICAHNAGAGGAMTAWRNGGTLENFDAVTAGGDYVSSVRELMTQVAAWLAAHPNWVAQPGEEVTG